MTPYAYLNGVMFALATVVLVVPARKTNVRGAWALVGATAGLGTYFRHDLFAFAIVALLFFTAAWWVLFHRARFPGKPAQAAGLVALGAVAVALVTWGPIFLSAGVSQP